MPRSRKQDQLAFDEINVEDTALQEALEKRLRAKDDRDEVALVFKRADEAAKAELARFEIAPDAPLRVGRFRISRTVIAGRMVEAFETKTRDRIRFDLIEDDEPAVRSEAEDADAGAIAALESAKTPRKPRRATTDEPPQALHPVN